MLQWLTGSKVDHPMASEKAARQILKELPADPLKALDEAAEWLDSLTRTDGFSVIQRFERIDMVDAAAKPHQRRVAQSYLAAQRQQKFQENRIWSAAHQFWELLAEGYLRCVADCESGASGAAAARKTLPVIVARAMRAVTVRMKWILLRYGQCEPRIWTELSRLYILAEKNGFAATEIAIYPGAHGGGSVRQELLKALMLATASTESLTPVRQEIAERLIASFSSRFRLAGSVAPGANYYFDLAAARAPARLIRRDAIHPTMRFFGAGEAFPALQRVLEQLVETGALPSEIHVGGDYDKDLVIGVMKHLLHYWSDTPPARGSERRRTVARLTVVPGLAEILRTLEPGSGDNLDFSGQPAVESWIADNVSDGGCGAIVPARKSDWVRVGCLIGMHAETDRHWGLGVIRRVTRDEHQNRRVGIQVLTRTAIPVKLSAPDGRALASGERAEPAVLLSTSPDRSGEVGIVMRAGLYNARDSLEMVVGGKTYLLLPARLAEGGEDFDWSRYRVMRKTRAE